VKALPKHACGKPLSPSGISILPLSYNVLKVKNHDFACKVTKMRAKRKRNLFIFCFAEC